MDSKYGQLALEDRLIDFIFQYSPEEQMEYMSPAVEDTVSDATLWHRFVQWVSRN